ncbi:uncharacterized protein TRAVEDRAFT_115375, partial [Trametes versicolor FP-101664 SS1]|uniref:uncharacterized protein n=1 Tax=Trametes versicolor (strain FP-101664) TaxID=717944 RepID=UPI0004624208
MRTSLHVVFQNVNHSPQHTHLLLEQCAARDVDVVCIQEPWYGPIRPIPSASPAGPAERTDDNMLYGTQLHPAWTLVEPRKDARVVCHVSRKLSNAVLSLDPNVSHRDCMILLLRLDPTLDPLAILNIYNDAQNHAIEYLTDNAQRLPVIDVAGGDYNTHSRVWDPDYPPDSAARSGEVLELHAHLGLRLLSPPGIHTHFPHRHALRPTVIDLIWVPNDRPHQLYTIEVAADERGLSDHAVIHVEIPAPLWSLDGAPGIPPKSEEEQEFVADVCAAVQQRLPPEFPLHNEHDLRSAVDTLFDCISSAWTAHATPLRICDKSRQWWDEACSAARDDLKPSASVRRAFRVLKSTIRTRRRTHLDERIQFVAEKQR